MFCPATDRRIQFSKDVLRGKKIKSLFIFTDGTFVHPARSPKSGNYLTPTSVLESISIFANLIDTNGTPIVLNLDTNLCRTNIFDLNINSELDYDKSEFTVKSDLTDDLRFLLYVVYDQKDKSPFTEAIENTQSVSILTSYVNKDIRLADILPRSLHTQPIKKLFVNGYFIAYFDIISTDGKRIELLPSKILMKKTPDEFYLDNFSIDLEKSFLRFPGRSYTYTSYITFIY